MNRQTRRDSKLLVLAALVIGIAANAQAAAITGSQTGQGEWTYDLTFDPLDNYSIFQPETTITLSGLSGVTQAFGPTSTDFPSAFIDAVNLLWTPSVLNGGTSVQWVHIGSGTGNFGSTQHVFGFRVLAPGAVNGSVSMVTDGMSRDFSNPLPGDQFDLDISGLVDGPVAATPVPEPATFALVGLGLLGALTSRRVRPRE